jgi:UDP-N-acetyl-D-glucosamine dehydrogenase
MYITVVGQGYVGLPLAIKAADSGFTVFGLDDNEQNINKLKSGNSFIEDLSDQVIQTSVDSLRYIPTTDQEVIAKSQVVLICVPTPLSSDHRPDLSALISATTTVGKNLKAGSLVIVESTIEPGTCRNILLPILIKESGLKASDFELAYSPERIDPTNKKWSINNTPKLVAGLTESAAQKAESFYGKFINSITKCSSLEIAETAKLLENSFRLVNISFINELAIFCQKIGIDIGEVISAAATKPYGFMPFYPSVGVGGHCIPVDPIYLANAAKAVGAPSRFIELADKINQEMPGYFVGRAEEKLGGLKNKRVLVVGVSYKPNVADVRETPVESLIVGLKQKGAQVSWHDDLVKEWNGEKSVPLGSDFDLAIIATPHDYLDLIKLGNVPILNTRGSI